MVPLKEAALLPSMIERARSPITTELLIRRSKEVREELAAIDRPVLLEETRSLILRNEVGLRELASVFAQLGIINKKDYVGVLKLALMLNDDRVIKMAVEEVLENGVSIFEIRDVVCGEGFAQKMDAVYSVFSPSLLPSYEFVFRAREKHFGREDVEGIRNAVALLVAKEKTATMLRNEYRKKGCVKEYSKALLSDAEKELEKIAKDEDGKVCEDDFALALYRAYFEDVCLFKNKEAVYYYLRLIEKYRVRNPFLTAIVEHALEHGEKRAREKALMLIRDFRLNIDVEKVFKSENLNERVLALQTTLRRGWNKIFREMLFSEWYNERKIALEAFLKYKPEINAEEERWIKKLARTETGRCGALARQLLKNIPERKAEEQKPVEVKMFDAVKKESIEKSRIAAEWISARAERVFRNAFEAVKRVQPAAKLHLLTEKTRENSAKIVEAVNVHARSTYRNAVEASKNIFACLGSISFNLRLEWIEKRAGMAKYAEKIKRKVQDGTSYFFSALPNLAGRIRIDGDWKKVLGYSFLLFTMLFATSFNPSKTRSIRIVGREKIVLAIEKNKEEKEKIVLDLAEKVAKGEMTLMDATKIAKKVGESDIFITTVKKTEPPKQKPKPRMEMDEQTKKMYVEAMGTIAITKGMDSFEYARGMLVEKYYLQNVGSNKWVNILIFGDNTAWIFPTANIGNSLSEKTSIGIGDILLASVESAYVLSDNPDGDGYLIAYHDPKNGLRIVKLSLEEIKSKFNRVLSTEEANEFAKQKICEQLNLNPEEYNVRMKPLVFPTDYNCDRRWDEELGCWVGDAHDYGAQREGGARRHEGTDLYAPFKAPVYSPVDGIVVAAGWGGKKAGKRVWVRGVDGYYYMMAHLDSVAVKTGQFITAGTVIGTVGETGNAKGLAPFAAHNHQEVHIGGMKSPIDPDKRIYDEWSIGLEKKSRMQMAAEERYLKTTEPNTSHE